MGWLVGLPLGLFRLLGGGVLLAVRIFWPVLLGLAAAALVRRMRRPAEKTARKERPPREPHFDGPVYTVEYQEVCQQPLSQEPDGPEPFGYKTGWLAIRCQDPRRVLETLGGTDVRPANWKTGLAAAEGPGGQVFVSPSLDGWVLAVGLLELGEDRALLERLAAEFEEVQFFATHRVTEHHAWLRYQKGALVRDYCYSGDQGAVERDAGALTPEEQALGFGRFPRKGDAGGESFPCEEDVLDIAAAWGADPRFARKKDPPSTGWVCTWGDEKC